MMVDNNQTENLQFTESLDKMRQFAKAMDAAIKLSDLTTSNTRSWTIFNKDNLRTYLQNPYAANSQINLMNLAKFLYTLSFPLRRMVNYFASLPDFSAYKINLDFSMTKDNDEEKLLKDYEDACRLFRHMNLEINMFKLLIIAWREGVVYFQPYQDKDGEMLLMPLDSQYCKISSIGYNNLYHVAFDFSFFTGANAFYLDVWDPEFKKKYNAYQKDQNLRWQELDNARVFKIDMADRELIVSPFASLFEPIIDLVDLQNLSKIKDTLEIYKLLVMRIPMLNSQNPDDMALSLELAKRFYNRAVEDLPEEIGLILSPMPVDSISFDKHSTSESNAIMDSYENLMESAGVAQIFSSSRLSGSTSVKMSMLTDAMFATKGIVQQVEAFVNERLQMTHKNSAAYIQFIDVTTYSKDDRISQVQKAAEMGLPVKMELASLLGYDPIEAIASDWLETKLGLSTTKFIHPLVSSHTQSAGTGEAVKPELDDGDLSDAGERTRDEGLNDK